MAEKITCHLCGEHLEDSQSEENSETYRYGLAILVNHQPIHNQIFCEKTELRKARIEIKNLKASVISWKDSWFHLREIIGNLWWHHPAIDKDDRRSYYQIQQKSVTK